VAGLVAGALGLAFLPHVEPNAVKPRAAVEKPQFVATAANVKTTTAPAPSATQAVAVASEAQNEQMIGKAPPSSPTPNPDVKPASQAAAAPIPAVATAKAEPPKAAPIAVAKAEPPTPSGKPIALAVMSPPTPPSSAIAKSAPEPAKPEVAASAESASWSVRGLVAFAKGDLSSARLYLERAAELGDPRAFVALADTYDPSVLAKLGVVCAPGDAQRAKDYLVKAAAAGVVSAKDRMAALDQAAH
jgi:TPR repeat protein